MNDIKQNIKQYLSKDKYFKIPAFQRGFKWGVPKLSGECDAEILLDNVIEAMHREKEEYFIQGVTVYEEEVKDEIVIIDGQQRTTTLFLLLNLLLGNDEKKKYFYYNNSFKLIYKIRKSSHEYIEAKCIGGTDQYDKDTQDIFYFKEAEIRMKNKIDKIAGEKDKLKEYILNNVMLFYIDVPKKQASKIFCMLNGAKAFMNTDELIKAEFLSKASIIDNEKNKSENISDTLEILKKQIGQDWKSNAIRSQYARQWDKWLYWWNREDVKAFFRCGNNPMGLLVEFFFDSQLQDEKNKKQMKYSNDQNDVSSVFKNFQNLLIKDTKDAKNNFEKLRKLQKQFEDIFNQPHFYNNLGLAMTLKAQDRKRTIRYFLDNFKDENKVRKYTLLKLANVSDTEILTEKLGQIEEKVNEIFDILADKDIYNDQGKKEIAYLQLFRLNVDESSKKDIKFEFFYYEEKTKQLEEFYLKRSLEHIWPKSKVRFKKSDSETYVYVDDQNKENEYKDNCPEFLKREDFELLGITEHCLGNLVFLHCNDNSKFNDRLPEKKKNVYFELNIRLYSRNLLHTMSVFAKDNWSNEKVIINVHENQIKTIELIKEGYKEYVR